MFGATFHASDGKSIRLWRWDAAEPKGTLLLVHGMAEHAKRYDRFAVEMMKRGYSVLAPDLRGHGETATQSELGDFGPGGYKRVLQDLREIRETVKTPCVLMGHSMGSSLAQNLAQSDGASFSGLILSGVALGDAKTRAMAPAVAKIAAFVTGGKKPNGMLDSMSFGSFNKPYEPAPTKFEWLSSDREEVMKYVKDPLCGFVCTSNFFAELATMIVEELKPANIAKIPKDLPVEIFTGAHDPAGGMGEHGRLIHKLWTDAGLSVGLTIYPHSRHEILNDADREAMTEAIAECLQEWM